MVPDINVTWFFFLIVQFVLDFFLIWRLGWGRMWWCLRLVMWSWVINLFFVKFMCHMWQTWCIRRPSLPNLCRYFIISHFLLTNLSINVLTHACVVVVAIFSRQENKKFVLALKKLEKNPVCQRQTLKSFLILPFQRITRLRLILEVGFRLPLLAYLFKCSISTYFICHCRTFSKELITTLLTPPT